MAAVNLSKTPRINLTKGQTVNLTKDGTVNSEKLNNVFFGAKWGSIIHKKSSSLFNRLVSSIFGDSQSGSIESVDLDASLLMYNEKYKLVDSVYYAHKTSVDGAIHHSGDDLHGTGGDEEEEDNETISMSLDSVSPKVQYIVAILNSYRHHKFDQIPYMKLRIYTGKLGKPDEILCAYNMQNEPSFNGKEAVVLGFFYRSEAGWKFKASGFTTKENCIQTISTGSAIKVIKLFDD